MRLVYVLCLAAIATGVPAVDKKPDLKPKPDPKAEQLVGTWALTHFDGDPVDTKNRTNIFTIDGKVSAAGLDKYRRMRVRTGEFWVKGTELHLDFEESGGSPAHKGFVYIEELTADRLVIVAPKSEGGVREVFKRVTDKK